MERLIKIKEFTEPITELFNESGESLGFINSTLSLNDVLIQIKKQKLEGYFIMFNCNIIDIDKNGRIRNLKDIDGFYDTYFLQMKEIMGF